MNKPAHEMFGDLSPLEARPTLLKRQPRCGFPTVPKSIVATSASTCGILQVPTPQSTSAAHDILFPIVQCAFADHHADLAGPFTMGADADDPLLTVKKSHYNNSLASISSPRLKRMTFLLLKSDETVEACTSGLWR